MIFPSWQSIITLHLSRPLNPDIKRSSEKVGLLTLRFLFLFYRSFFSWNIYHKFSNRADKQFHILLLHIRVLKKIHQSIPQHHKLYKKTQAKIYLSHNRYFLIIDILDCPFCVWRNDVLKSTHYIIICFWFWHYQFLTCHGLRRCFNWRRRHR